MRLTAAAKAAGALIAAASFVAPAAVVAAPAHADPTQDAYFFQYLDQKGVPYGRKMDAVRIAKETCLKISRPGPPGSIGYGVFADLKKEMGFNSVQSQQFTEAAIYQYCPQVWHINQQ
jgi:Protein of unknown function (DUF732)